MMNRRTLLAGSVALTGSVTPSAVVVAEAMHDRPAFNLAPDGNGWRVCSWERDGDAWRPSIAHIRAAGGQVHISGHIANIDYDVIISALRTEGLYL